MRTLTGFGAVVLAEFLTVGVAALAVRVRRRRRPPEPPPFLDDGVSVVAVLEIQDRESLLPPRNRRLPAGIFDDLRADPTLGLADVQIVQHVQATGAGLPERSQVGRSYQTLNESTARTIGPRLDESEPAPAPVPAVRLTWLSLRLELPGSRRADGVERAAEPIAARGGGRAGAGRTLDKAVQTASAKLSVAGFTATRLAAKDLTTTLETTSYGTHLGPADVETDSGGVLVGVDPAHQPVVLGLFSRRLLTAALVGGPYLAQLLALRAAAVGARVIVETGRDELWDPLVLESGLDGSRLAVQPVGRIAGNRGWPAPSPTAPILVLRDCGARPPFAAMPNNPWTTILTFLPYLDPRALGQLASADLVGMQRMPAEEVETARAALRLARKDADAVPDFPDVMTLWLARAARGAQGASAAGTVRYCETVPTSWETGILGDPAR